MDINSIQTLITSVGFPIVCCLGLGWYIKYLTDSHKTEIDSLREVINANTLIVTKLYEKMKGDNKDE